MHLNKKSIVKAFLVGVLLLSVGFLIVVVILPQILHAAEKKTAEAVCKLSVISREKSYTEIKVTRAELKVGSVATPLLCKTIDKFIPEDKEASEEDVKKEIAGLMASCWNEFGEGHIKDVFKQGDPVNQNCFVCYNVNLRGTSKFKGKIEATEFRKYMFENAYKSSSKGDNCKVNGGFCINSENREDCFAQIQADPSYITIDKKNSVCNKIGKTSCCYTEYECWNKGGKCSNSNPDETTYAQYSSWECPSKMKCFVNKEYIYSYKDYIQIYGGPGSFMILSDIEPGQTYAVSFGSPTGECEWCRTIGIGFGVGTAVVGIASGIPTGGVGTTLYVVSALFGAGYLGGRGLSEKTAEILDIKKLFQREINTVYFTTLTQIQDKDTNLCTLVHDVRET